MKMIINIVAGGPKAYLPDLSTLFRQSAHHDKWVGVDKGTIRLIEVGITPDAGFGDFDSVTSEEMDEIDKKCKAVFTYPSEKNETDLELALLWAFQQNPDTVRIFGATGGRMDHTFANIMLLSGFEDQKGKVDVKIVDRTNEVSIVHPGEYTITRGEHTYVSFMPISETVTDLTLTGFKYPLQNELIERGKTLTMSNELKSNSGTFSFKSGILMVIRSKD